MCDSILPTVTAMFLYMLADNYTLAIDLRVGTEPFGQFFRPRRYRAETQILSLECFTDASTESTGLQTCFPAPSESEFSRTVSARVPLSSMTTL